MWRRRTGTRADRCQSGSPRVTIVPSARLISKSGTRSPTLLPILAGHDGRRSSGWLRRGPGRHRRGRRRYGRGRWGLCWNCGRRRSGRLRRRGHGCSSHYGRGGRLSRNWCHGCGRGRRGSCRRWHGRWGVGRSSSRHGRCRRSYWGSGSWCSWSRRRRCGRRRRSSCRRDSRWTGRSRCVLSYGNRGGGGRCRRGLSRGRSRWSRRGGRDIGVGAARYCEDRYYDECDCRKVSQPDGLSDDRSANEQASVSRSE